MTSGPAGSGGQVTSQGREQSLVETFVVLADTLVDDYDIVELLDLLVTSCVQLFDITQAGLLLADQKGNLAVIVSSSEETRLLEVFQLQNHEGACLECVRSGQAVTCADLSGETTRWPLFAPAAVAAGFCSVVALPLRLRNQTIGALSLFSRRAQLISASDHRLAQALADVATIGILHRRASHHQSMLSGQLQHALNSRVIIEQAKGILAERSGANMDAAFNALRSYARGHNLKLTDVATAVVRGDIDLAGPPATTTPVTPDP
jgi:transcriptional regulator with GAF, ATPase, and Fis domain